MLKDLGVYLWQNKKWWLIPPIIMFLLVGALIAFSSATPVSPFIYALF
jgi:hypothetical protein